MTISVPKWKKTIRYACWEKFCDISRILGAFHKQATIVNRRCVDDSTGDQASSYNQAKEHFPGRDKIWSKWIVHISPESDHSIDWPHHWLMSLAMLSLVLRKAFMITWWQLTAQQQFENSSATVRGQIGSVWSKLRICLILPYCGSLGSYCGKSTQPSGPLSF